MAFIRVRTWGNKLIWLNTDHVLTFSTHVNDSLKEQGIIGVFEMNAFSDYRGNFLYRIDVTELPPEWRFEDDIHTLGTANANVVLVNERDI